MQTDPPPVDRTRLVDRALLHALVLAWDTDDETAFDTALILARSLLGVTVSGDVGARGFYSPSLRGRRAGARGEASTRRVPVWAFRPTTMPGTRPSASTSCTLTRAVDALSLRPAPVDGDAPT